MERRDLLISLTFLMVTPIEALAAAANSRSQRFNWTPDGRVYRRDGVAWVESISLGEDIRILHIDESGPVAVLTAELAGRQFQLRSSDGRRWRVA